MSTAKALDIMVFNLTSSLVSGDLPYESFPKFVGESYPALEDIVAVSPSKDSSRDAPPFLYPVLKVAQQPLLDQIDALATLYGAPESFIAGAICALYWVLDPVVNPPPLVDVVALTKEGT